MTSAVVLAGGIGRRSAPLGLTRPKALFELLGRPLIAHVLESLRQAGLEDVIVVTGPDTAPLRDALGDGEAFGLRLRFVVQERPLGQADGLSAARAHCPGPVLVMNANDVYDPSLLADLAALGRDEALDVGLVGRTVEDPSLYGVLDLNAAGRLTGIVEKPAPGTAPSNVAVVGLYWFSGAIWPALDATPAGATDDQLERAIQQLIDTGRGGHLAYNGPFASFKHPWHVLAISDLLLEREVTTQRISPGATVSPHAVIDGPVVIEDGVRVLEHAVIRGPAFIGRGTIVGNGTLLRGGVSIGRHCVIGHATEVSHSVLGNDCWTHKNFVGDSVIGDNCSFGAGTITANLRFDERPVEVTVGSGRVSAGAYCGSIMGEHCRTGSNAVLLPGTRIGPNSIVGPGVVLARDLPPDRIALLSSDSYEVRENRIDVSKLSRTERLKALKES